MPFEEDLRRQFEALTDRIRAEVARQLAMSTDELIAAAEAERVGAVRQAKADGLAEAEQVSSGHLTSAVADAEERGRLEGHEAGRKDGLAQGRLEGRQEGLAEGRQEGLAEGRREGLAEGREERHQDALGEARAIELAAGERLLEAVRAIDGAPSLSEILDSLASRAGREAARVGLLLVRGGQLRGWRFIGFGAALDEADGFEVALAEGGVIAEAVRKGEPVFADLTQSTSVPSFATASPGREMLAVPIPMNGHVVAVLYADQAGDDSTRHVEPERKVWPATLEVLARHATRCLETVTVLRAAQIATERTEPSARLSASSSASVGGSDESMTTNGRKTDEDEEAARRYARLLISEIRLYHEPEVIAGRRDRDVAVRLGGPIARARGLYEQRVPAHVRAETDHFHAELVRTLADGDPSLLGQAP